MFIRGLHKLVVVPCVEEEGKLVIKGRPFYSYHHILAVFVRDGDSKEIATVNAMFDNEKLLEVAKTLSDGVEIEVDPDFYAKQDLSGQNSSERHIWRI